MKTRKNQKSTQNEPISIQYRVFQDLGFVRKLLNSTKDGMCLKIAKILILIYIYIYRYALSLNPGRKTYVFKASQSLRMLKTKQIQTNKCRVVFCV